ncbi:hypothetical protein LA20533_05245 [Amylolactobacillus amylophilus DSM 20533 = JCM 1125]|uniref:Uncharacterized protein n=1 Tax=Amylolactobacillus amylophilus DSM 20533 = JCM 1125 TaxID=1423721 RepID=A0A1L6XCK2_9LACO|nr:hypothetical protein LA20533_05245 [Amylolactobacillus amylophilus DSM 20533 = JCM 1125]
MRAIFCFEYEIHQTLAARYKQGGRFSKIRVSVFLVEGVDPLRARKPKPLFWFSDTICDSATPLKTLDFIGF